MHRSRKWCESGVSEVIGTIFILVMTVTLFASVIVWVSSFPTPQAAIRLDMDGTLSPVYDGDNNWAGATITVLHRGGEQLQEPRTNVFLAVQRGPTLTNEILRNRGSSGGEPYGIDGPDDRWDAGESWTYTNASLESTDTISLTVLDTVRSLILWTDTLRGPSGTYPPLFVEKWVDGDMATAFTRDIPLTGKQFATYVRLSDPDGDLQYDNVTAEFTFGPLGTYRLYEDGTHGDRIPNDGIFSRTDPAWVPLKAWDAGIVILRARDAAGHATTSRLVLEVKAGPGDLGDGFGSGPLDLLHRNEFQAYAIYNESEWDDDKWAAEETRTFVKGEVVVVVVASQYLKNLELLNEFILYDPDDVPEQPVVYGNFFPGATTRPSSTRAFGFLEFVSGFYVYEYRFATEYDTNELQLDPYQLRFDLRAGNVDPPRNRFSTVDVITITDQNGTTVHDYPQLEFFKDDAFQFPATEFEFTDIMYVRVKVSSSENPILGGVTTGEVIISDYIGGTQVWARPGVPPVGAVQQSGVRHYKFTIDLSVPTTDPWIIGRNSYGFRLELIKDSNEDYTLSEQVIVNGPRWRLDIGSAINEYSHPNFDQKWYALFNEIDRLWATTVVQKWDSGPSNSNPPWGAGPFFSIAFSDFDGDMDLDAVTGIQAGEIFLYRNVAGSGHEWAQTLVKNHGSQQVKAVAAGRLDTDRDNDIAAGLNNGSLYWYSNEGGTWREYHIVDFGTAEVRVIKLADVDGDGDKDLFVGRSDNFVTIYRNTPLLSPQFLVGQSINVGATVYDMVVADMGTDNGNPTPDGYNDIVVARGSSVDIYWGPSFAGTIRSLPTTNLAWTVDVGDLNEDSYLDVVAGTDAGNVYRWTNAAWGRATVVSFDANGKVRAVRVADVDGDGLDDIVVGAEDGSGPSSTCWVRWLRRIDEDPGGLESLVWVSYTVQKLIGLNPGAYDIDVGDVDRGVLVDRSV